MCSHWPREICPLINLYGFLAGLFLYSRMKTAPAYFHGHKKRRIVFYPGGSHADNNFTPHNKFTLEKSFVWKLLEERKWKEKEAKRRKRNATSTDYLVLANTACVKNWSESREIWMPRMSLFLIITETKRAAWRSSRKLHKLTKSIRTFYEYTFYEYYAMCVTQIIFRNFISTILWDSTIIIVLEKFVTEV